MLRCMNYCIIVHKTKIKIMQKHNSFVIFIFVPTVVGLQIQQRKSYLYLKRKYVA